MIHDLAVLGAGPGGFEAALAASRAGLKTALVEKDELGGVCLNRGCVPSKLLLGALCPAEELRALGRAGLCRAEFRPDLAAIRARSQRIMAATRKAMAKRLAEAGVDVVRGQGALFGPNRLLVETPEGQKDIEFKDLILATGSRPAMFPGLEADNENVLDSSAFLDLDRPPASLIVVGAGFIGLEMACMAHLLGAEITLVDALTRPAAGEDPEVSAEIEAACRRRGWDLRLGVRVESLATGQGQAKLVLKGGETILAHKALAAVGRTPNSQGLGLEDAGMALEGPGWVRTDQNLMASANAYAVGDVNGRLLLAHAAADQARYAVRRVLGLEKGPYAPGPVPSVIYGSPEVLRVGAMAAELKAQGKSPEVSRAALAANPIAQAHAAPQGLVKVVWLDGRVAGVTAVGFEVSRLTGTAMAAVTGSWTRQRAEAAIFAHPTLDEALREALLAERTRA
ncbi:MAG: NAD(P)/FAD-dependent oxidoreductase [Desulfovibrionaceae bacterium]|nr:NAD(P)/FAD-dependent oxidoreductase [Desulfovibrionaceae bacterium]